MLPGLAQDLFRWFSAHGRDLPWRATRDPYAIWVSEIMLQQTRVATVITYYQDFLERFPTVTSLAAAPLGEVLKVWEGMGYYARARNLHRAAGIVVEEFDGKLPRTVQELLTLPGVGRYTAAALAAIAFGQDSLALEGNLQRVLTRVFDLHVNPRKPQGAHELLRRSTPILPAGRASEFNQALMDLGALVCTPRSPNCPECPIAVHCLALRRGTQEELPIRVAKAPLPHRRAVAAVLESNGYLLIRRRPEEGLLGGLWGFPGGLVEQGESREKGLSRLVRKQLGLGIRNATRLGKFHHTYSHFRVTLHTYACQVSAQRRALRETGNVRWVNRHELSALAMGKLDRMLANSIINPGPSASERGSRLRASDSHEPSAKSR